MKKIFILCIICILSFSYIHAQDNGGGEEANDKYSVENYMVKRITSCKYGYIVEYFFESYANVRTVYIPFKFFTDGSATRIEEENENIAPQMNIVYKNFKPYRIKLYFPLKKSSLKYRFLPVTSDAIRDEFNFSAVSDMSF